jgi:8-oxo-dGTP diphosphatase
MTEELLDIFNENNEPTGKSAPRNVIHTEGIWHRTVHIYLFRKSKGGIEVLVHLRAPFKDSYPNCWDTRFGGHIKSGISMEEGLKAELKEEIGLDSEKYKIIEGFWHKRDIMPNREFSKKYFIEYPGDIADLKFNDGEVQEIKWLSMQEIKNSLVKDPEKWADSLDGFTEVADHLSKMEKSQKNNIAE